MRVEDLDFFDTGEQFTGIDNPDPVTIPKDTDEPGDKGIKDKNIIIDEGNDDIIEFGDPPIVDDPEGDSKTSSSSSNVYLNLAKALSEKGVVDEFDDALFDDKEAEQSEVLIKLLKSTVDSNIDSYKSKVSGRNLEALEMLERGEDISDYLKIKNDTRSIENISIEDLENDDNLALRKKVIGDYYKETTNMSDERIAKNIQRMIDLGEDVDEAKVIHGDLIGIREEKAARALEAKRLEAENQQKNFNTRLESLRTEVDEIDLNFLGTTTKKARDKYYNMLTQPVSTTENINAVTKKRQDIGETKFDIMLAALIDKGVFDGKLDKISSKQRLSAIDQLEASINNGGFSGGQGGRTQNNSKGGNPDEIMRRNR